MENQDAQLLRRYARDGCEEAFKELVCRYMNLVWAAAWRTSRNAEIAQDVVQVVFTDLARKARSLPDKVVLPGWLHRAARMAAAKAVRENARRVQREREAMEQQHHSGNDPEQDRQWRELMPFLDDALGALNETDRNAVLLRFFASKSFAEIGTALAMSDDAAQKRLSRALDKMRSFFEQRGLGVSTASLTGLLVAAGSQSAPAGLLSAAAVSSLAVAGSGASGGILASLTASLPIEITAMKTKVTCAAIAMAAVSGPLLVQHHTLGGLRTEHEALSAEVQGLDGLREQNAILLERQRAAEELQRLRLDEREFFALHAEADRLRAEAQAALELQQELAAARTALEQVRTGADWWEAVFRFRTRRSEIRETGKVLGGLARMHATYHGQEQLPGSLELMTDILNEPSVLQDYRDAHGHELEPNLFEFVPHARPIRDTESELVLIREKQPRKSPHGGWERIYVHADGSVWVRRATDLAEFEDYERKRRVLEP